MNVFDIYQRKIAETVLEMGQSGKLPANLDTHKIVVEPPRDMSHGDLATNVALVFAKEVRMAPRALAEILVGPLSGFEGVSKVEIAGPGFINLKLDPAIFHRVIGAVLEQKTEFGRSRIGAGQKVNVEFVSANPTGPMHVGHGRGAVFGDALASLLDFAGFDVTR